MRMERKKEGKKGRRSQPFLEMLKKYSAEKVHCTAEVGL
jgi:hypothetical protein